MRYFRVKTVNANGNLNARSSASLSASIKATISNGSSIVSETSTADDIQADGHYWVRTVFAEQTVYVARDYLVEVDVNGNVIKDYTTEKTTNNNNNDNTNNSEETVTEEKSKKTILIVGGVVLAVGALMNVFM